ncbi:MAG: hypothetical protein QOK17_486 [Sphingomonadales bacterium]|jgi:hypothetical protein|nr:hypothetical protein [Sphingomonadales bacterium]
MRAEVPIPFALSLSKGFTSFAEGEGEGFDRLSPNGGSAAGTGR